ncbi:unnamed protein product [Linum tenue]|uniref:PLAT domain-containing protein n=2 Tax=Linum TaxID=4005 RepID=A0AAV0RAP2_9ROSI|nr:unnamed protein product [Linum tenue]
MASRLFLLPAVLLLLAISAVPSSADDDDCVYTLFVRTGSIFKGGTDSAIGAWLYDTNGYYLKISDLQSWAGLMGPGYNYYERGNLDIFSGRAPCLTAPICALNLTSDGSGDHHGWYCNYVETAVTAVHGSCSQQTFTVEQWLATDVSPYELSAVRNFCPYDLGAAGDRKVRDVRQRSSSSPAGGRAASAVLRQVVAAA